MKKTIKTLSVILFASVFAITSCQKKEDNTPEESTPPTNGGTTGGNASNSPITPTFADGEGTFVATKANVTTAIPGTTITTNVTMGSATASIFNTAGGSTLVDGGTVISNDSTLAKQSNNAYIFTPKSVTGINWTNNSRWSVSGNSTNNIPVISYTANGFPSDPTVNNITSVSKGSSFTMNTTSISNADSLCFQITSGSKTIYKMTNGSQTSYTFPASEMGTLDISSNAYLTISAYRFNNTTVSSKKYYFINLNTSNRMVSVTN